nr:bifunctional [glutamate--ammonia ligase]-adenylyl-L-tyrosine phosphorylase/[glutamate--ammonia-ligase] adenylyltransferase [Alteromonas halophila]
MNQIIMPVDYAKNSKVEHRVETLWQRLEENAPEPERLTSHKTTLSCLFARSSFVAEQFIQHPQWIDEILDDTAAPVPEPSQYQALVRQSLKEVTNEDELLARLRLSRHFYMTRIACCDLLNQQTIEASLSQVSALADALISEAYSWYYSFFEKKFGTPEGPHGKQPMYILAMGKLGGRELNFSSDIDLIFAYPVKGSTSGGKKSLENQQFFTRLAQKLISSLNKVTADGQVFRVDMRLRPFGESGPLTIHFAALEDYYQEQGRHWERFAMVKARVVNPQAPAYQDQLEEILQPFTYRRYLDFTTLDALRDMKRLIATEIRRRRLDNNIKLGAGGIREVEFFAQSFQLIHGGREQQLQQRSLLKTLKALSTSELIEQQVTDTLRDNYLFLRKAEHTLQQFGDEQTQTLPDDPVEQQALADVMGFADYDAFLISLRERMADIHAHFNELVEESHESHDASDTLFTACRDAWQLGLDEAEFCDTLSEFTQQQVAKQLHTELTGFRQQQRGYRTGQRGESILNKLMPELLYVLIEHSPNKAAMVLSRVLKVIDAITGRTTYLDLLLENPDVLKQLVRLCERSDWIANEIRRFPILLDELLTPLYLQRQNTDIQHSRNEYEQELRQTLLRIEADDVEHMMDAWRQFKLCQQLRIAASDISGSLPIANVSDKLTVLAETLLHSVVQSAWQQVTDRFGKPAHLQPDTYGFAVIGYGKLGGYELGYGSDLDLVFVHNAPRESKTDGDKSIEAQQFYIKLTQRVMHLLNTTTLFGQLYETDLRLRPSGNAGLLCCHISGFARYQREEAWTWEHQALVRARGVLGDKDLLEAFENEREYILGLSRNNSQLREDVVSMRKKMRKHLLASEPEMVDLKQCEGGITDIEFLTQYWVLGHACKHPEISHFTDNLRLLNVICEAGIIHSEQARMLQDAYLQLRDQYHQLTLADHKFAKESTSLNALKERVLSVWNDVLGNEAPDPEDAAK